MLALSILPFVLAGCLILFGRLRGPGRQASPTRQVVPKQLLLLSAVAIVSHPMLDTLNTYGVRWLMPFSGRWYYGDALFIADPWVWLALGAGVVLSWWGSRRGTAVNHRPVRLALGAVGLYMGSMWVSGLVARRIISRELEALSGQPVELAMAGPVPLSVLTRSFVAQQDTAYRVGSFRWLASPHIDLSGTRSFPRRRPLHPAFAVAESTRVMRRFLGWARFPTFELQATGPHQYMVHAVDLRYARRPGENFGAISVPVSLPSASVPAR